MKSNLLKLMYQHICGDSFNNNSKQILTIQNIVYLLHNMGFYVGKYGFSLDDGNMISFQLRDDILSTPPSFDLAVVDDFTSEAMKAFNFIKDSIKEKPHEYSTHEWLSCLATLYCFKYEFHYTDKNTLLSMFKKECPHLKNKEGNLRAIKWIDKIKNYEM